MLGFIEAGLASVDLEVFAQADHRCMIYTTFWYFATLAYSKVPWVVTETRYSTITVCLALTRPSERTKIE